MYVSAAARIFSVQRTDPKFRKKETQSAFPEVGLSHTVHVTRLQCDNKSCFIVEFSPGTSQLRSAGKNNNSPFIVFASFRDRFPIVTAVHPKWSRTPAVRSRKATLLRLRQAQLATLAQFVRALFQSLPCTTFYSAKTFTRICNKKRYFNARSHHMRHKPQFNECSLPPKIKQPGIFDLHVFFIHFYTIGGKISQNIVLLHPSSSYNFSPFMVSLFITLQSLSNSLQPHSSSFFMLPSLLHLPAPIFLLLRRCQHANHA